MTAELTVLALAAVLQAVQIALAGIVVNRDAGHEWNTGPRDSQPQLSPLAGRLRRAVSNHFEALAFFTIAVVVVQFAEANSTLTAACAWTYLGARCLYVPAYALGLSPWRSVVFGVGFAATFVMIFAALL